MHFLDDDSFTSLFPNEIECINRLVSLGVLHRTVDCPSCNSPMDLVVSDLKKVFRCPKLICANRELSCRTGSVFFGSRLQVRQIMRISRCWLQCETPGQAVMSTKLMPHTISTWYSAFRELVSCNMRQRNEMFGGPDIIVEIDETLLGRRKYNKGHHVEGVWTMVGIERTPERRAFCVVVERRDAETIRSVVRSKVREGSIVYTEEWRGYIGIDISCNVVHQTVNHSRFFRDPITGVCTNTVEGLNRALKSSIPPRYRTNQYASQFVDQFIWMRLNKRSVCDAFIQLLRSSLLETK